MLKNSKRPRSKASYPKVSRPSGAIFYMFFRTGNCSFWATVAPGEPLEIWVGAAAASDENFR